MKQKIIFIVGPTAIGKSDIAVSLAKKIKGEIISCDSMQIYKRMDILANLPSNISQKKIPHHLISILSPTKEYNVSKYRKSALKILKDILKRGKTPIFSGGSGLYMSILIDGIFEQNKQDQNIRKRLYKIAQRNGSSYLYKRLQVIDPDAALKIHPNDKKRIVRALEVFQATGFPISVLQKKRQGLKDEYDVRIFALNMKREKLYKRINERVEKVFKKGLISEVKKLLKKKISRTASYAIGIKEVRGYLNKDFDLEEAKRLMQRNSRRYAKRQLTWFRKDSRINWINIKEKEKPRTTLDKIWKGLY